MFAKGFMARNGIPTARFRIFENAPVAIKYVQQAKYPLVIKADGLAAGKGVYICDNVVEATDAIKLIMIKRIFGDAGDKIVIEKFISGEEATYTIIVDVKNRFLPLASSQDHKRVHDGDKGPNTGKWGLVRRHQ